MQEVCTFETESSQATVGRLATLVAVLVSKESVSAAEAAAIALASQGPHNGSLAPEASPASAGS